LEDNVSEPVVTLREDLLKVVDEETANLRWRLGRDADAILKPLLIKTMAKAMEEVQAWFSLAGDGDDVVNKVVREFEGLSKRGS
jgi:hypothetical protein